MKLSSVPYSQNFVFRDLLSASCNKLLSDTKLIQQSASGHIIYSPIAQKIKKNIETIFLRYAQQYGFNEILFPVLMDKKLLDVSGKIEEFAQEFYSISDSRNNLLVSPTTEERMIDFVKNSGILSYKNLPMRFSQISNVYRNLKRAEGLYKSKEISCVVLTSFDKNKESYLQTIEDFKAVCDKSFADMGIQTFYVQDNESGAIEYMYNTELADRPLEKSIINNFGNANEFADKAAYGSLSMGYPFHQSDRFDLFFVDNAGKRQRPFMGTFGIGTQRCIHNLFEKAKNGERQAFTKSVRPFDVGIITVGVGSDNNLVKELSDKLNSMQLLYCIDDRNLSVKDKMQFSEFFSIPSRILIGKKELDTNSYSVKLLDSDTTNSLNLSETLGIITKLAMER